MNEHLKYMGKQIVKSISLPPTASVSKEPHNSTKNWPARHISMVSISPCSCIRLRCMNIFCPLWDRFHPVLQAPSPTFCQKSAKNWDDAHNEVIYAPKLDWARKCDSFLVNTVCNPAYRVPCTNKSEFRLPKGLPLTSWRGRNRIYGYKFRPSLQQPQNTA